MWQSEACKMAFSVTSRHDLTFLKMQHFQMSHPCSHHASFALQRHHFAQAIAILNTFGCNIFEKFSRKVTYNLALTRYNCLSWLLSLFPFTTCCHFCMCKLKSFVFLFFRTTSECWIWLETSFWLRTWLTTFAFSKICRGWLIVSQSSSVCTGPSLLLLYTHNPEHQRHEPRYQIFT